MIPPELINRVTQGNARRLLDRLSDACVDGIVTDPPYSSGGLFRGDRVAAPSSKYQSTENAGIYAEFSGDNRDQRSYLQWSVFWMEEVLRVAKPGAPLLVFTDWRQLPTISDALQIAGWIWRGVCVWDKTESARPQHGRFRAQCEYVLWGSNGPLWNQTRRDLPPLPGVFRQSVNSHDKDHIAAKPLPVMRWLMGIMPPGGVILDLFAGGGATLVAAVETGRSCVGFELDAHWTDHANQRVFETQVQLAQDKA